MPDPAKKSCTIRELARHVGLSTCTVSRVLNHRSGELPIPEKTQERIREAARALNYVPNVNAQRFFKRRSNVIGLLVPPQEEMGHNAFNDTHFVEILSGIEKALCRTGYNLLLLFNRPEFQENNHYAGLFQSGFLDGLLIWGVHRSDRYWNELAALSGPRIFLTSLPGAESSASLSFVARDYAHSAFARAPVPSRYMQFLPAVEHVVDKPGFHRPLIVSPDREGARLAEWSVTAKGYGEFLCDVFDVWVVSDVGRTFVQMFDATLAQWCGVPPGVCSMGETCGDALVVEHNGDVYSCDHFVYPEYKLGNIAQTPLGEIYRTAKRREFGLNKRNTLPSECLRCKFYFACRGECPKHRFDRGADGSPKNSLCEGLKIYFRHVEPYMEYMRDLLSKQQAPAWVMPFARKRMGLE